MKCIYNKIKSIIDEHYQPNEYPALNSQIKTWSATKPLKGLEILDATPIFRNTLTKYLAIIASGAKLTVGVSDIMPHDKKIVDFLSEIGVPLALSSSTPKSHYDVILDCAGAFSHLSAHIGYVELTRSGVDVYNNFKKPVFIADSGKIKQIETILGTGESLFRALERLGYKEWEDKKIVLFGAGKVGTGILLYGRSKKANITTITDIDEATESFISKCTSIVDYRERLGVINALTDADLIVTATGKKNIFRDAYICKAITESTALLANMGVEDEFGKFIPESRVLNQKKPLNFILEEPTHLKYIETTMALHNYGALNLEENPTQKGIINPPIEIEKALLAITVRDGIISSELNLINGLK